VLGGAQEQAIEVFESLNELSNVLCVKTLMGDMKLTHGMMKHKLISLFRNVSLCLLFWPGS